MNFTANWILRGCSLIGETIGSEPLNPWRPKVARPKVGDEVALSGLPRLV
jgi:hypothetical protein